MKWQDSPVPHGVIYIHPDEEVPWWFTPSFLPQYDHWVSCLCFLHIYRIYIELFYTYNLIWFLSVWLLSTSKESVVVGAIIWWGEVGDIFLLDIFPGDLCGWWFESFPCFNEDTLHLVWCTLECSMVSHTVHSCITIQIIELHVWTIIVWMVMHTIIWLEYERLYVLSRSIHFDENWPMSFTSRK